MKDNKTLFGKLTGAVASAAAGTVAVTAGAAVVMYRMFARANHSLEIKKENKDSFNEVVSGYASETWSFTSFDGLLLKGHFFKAKTPGHRYVILVHGYQGNYTDMMPYAAHYLAKGYHALMPDLRGHGQSEGSYVGFGYHDHFDLCGFIDLLKEKDPEARIVLHGMSMGAATVMMTAGEYLPSQVKCAIEDAGYTEGFEECAHVLDHTFHLPAFPLLNVVDLCLRKKAHYSLKDCSPMAAVAHATVPLLFIHGKEDDFAPFRMQQPLYEACSSEKELLAVDGAKHVWSVFTNPDLFWGTIDAFTEKHLQ